VERVPSHLLETIATDYPGDGVNNRAGIFVTAHKENRPALYAARFAVKIS
jgi:hypothetical protein